MIKYELVNVQKMVPVEFYCDRCKKKIEDQFELQETYTIAFTGGCTSVFGDGSEVACDLCQECLHELIGNFCQYK